MIKKSEINNFFTWFFTSKESRRRYENIYVFFKIFLVGLLIFENQPIQTIKKFDINFYAHKENLKMFLVHNCTCTLNPNIWIILFKE